MKVVCDGLTVLVNISQKFNRILCLQILLRIYTTMAYLRDLEDASDLWRPGVSLTE